MSGPVLLPAHRRVSRVAFSFLLAERHVASIPVQGTQDVLFEDDIVILKGSGRLSHWDLRKTNKNVLNSPNMVDRCCQLQENLPKHPLPSGSSIKHKNSETPSGFNCRTETLTLDLCKQCFIVLHYKPMIEMLWRDHHIQSEPKPSHNSIQVKLISFSRPVTRTCLCILREGTCSHVGQGITPS